MSFEHWNSFVESFKADQAARDQGGRAAGRLQETVRKVRKAQKGVNEHGKEGKAQEHAHSINDDDQPGAPAAS